MIPHISFLNAEARLLSLEPTEIYHCATWYTFGFLVKHGKL